MKKILCIAMAAVVLATPILSLAGPVDRTSSVVAGFQMTTPEENRFRIVGSKNEFVILDKDQNGDYFVLAQDYYGTRQYDSLNETAKFDVESPSNIAYFLNHQFLESGNTTEGKTYQLPAELIPYIDMQHEWKTEAGRNTSDIPQDYTVKAGVALLSQTEWTKYAAKFGDYDPGATIWGYWLRTARGKGVPSNNTVLCARVTDSQGTTNGATSNRYELIRPAFYLKKDFFKHVKLDTAALGLSVNMVLKTDFNRSDLGSLYTAAELSAIYKNLPPQAREVGVVGRHYVGNTMTGYYTYDDAEGDKESNSVYQWYRCQTGGTPFPITGATAKTYTVRDEDVGYHLIFEVIPANSGGKGTAQKSAESKQVKANLPPVATRVSILGKAYTDETLTGYYDYADTNDDLEQDSVFTWYRSDSADGEKTEIADAVGQSYTPGKADVGKYLTFAITPCAESSVNREGKQVQSTAFGPIVGLDRALPTITKESDGYHGSYTYDGYGTEPAEVACAWYISETMGGAAAKLQNATGQTYLPTALDEGYYLSFGTKVAGGRELRSQPVLIGDAAVDRKAEIAQPAALQADIQKEGLVSLTVDVTGLDFCNTMSAVLEYDDAALEFVDVQGELTTGLCLVTGDAGKKTLHLSMGAEIAGLRGDTAVCTIQFRVKKPKVKVTMRDVKLYKLGAHGALVNAAYTKMQLKEGNR